MLNQIRTITYRRDESTCENPKLVNCPTTTEPATGCTTSRMWPYDEGDVAKAKISVPPAINVPAAINAPPTI